MTGAPHPCDLVYPVASIRRALEVKLMRRRLPVEQGRPIVEAIGALAHAERTLRSMYPFDPTGL